MLNKGAIVETPNHLEGEFISNKLETPKSVDICHLEGEFISNKLETPKSVDT